MLTKFRKKNRYSYFKSWNRKSEADLATGLYLVDTPEVVTTNYTYTFTPYLVSLPTNNYYSNGNDNWIYDLTATNAIGLKPEEHARYGDLIDQ